MSHKVLPFKKPIPSVIAKRAPKPPVVPAKGTIVEFYRVNGKMGMRDFFQWGTKAPCGCRFYNIGRFGWTIINPACRK